MIRSSSCVAKRGIEMRSVAVRKWICLNTHMSDTRGNTKVEVNVGDIVQVRRDKVLVSGTIVEDYAEFSGLGKGLGRTWAHPHRWAIALASGVLVFVDDGDLEVGEAESD